ncbi:TolC family protein [Hyunsoonleella sp. SJ7]|uniref:TolC family protein n=1 Tax=Hyunsoonleella aquatilis TaxID=2762758 RepID=A0A923KGH8_9FLAO|nr:TolC family protein [Hyunsoonleella aquatilis]MBC3758346.1 TolC family protein [Hyunsoonleella aquatilis]
MRKKNIVLFCLFSLSIAVGFAQIDSAANLTLDNCITIAIKNNLDVKSSKLDTKSSKLNFKQSLNQLLPNLNGNYNIGVNNGRSIDPFTNTYSNSEFTFSNFGMNLNLTLFNGFNALNRIKRDKFNLRAAEMEQEETIQNLIIDVTVAYIRILNSRDMLALIEARMEVTERQLERLEDNYNEGVGNPANYTNMQGQYASDKVALLNAQNTLEAAIISFSRLLNLEVETEAQIQYLSGLFEPQVYGLSVSQVYQDALENLATFKARQYRIDAAKSNIKVARSNYYPQISVFSRLNTNYSSLAETFTETGTSTVETGNFVTIDNQDYPVLQNKTQFTGNKISYEDQFENNLSTVVGLSVQIPLFNRFQARNNVKLQKIQLEDSKIQLESTKLSFKQAIEQAYISMETAYSVYNTLTEQVKAYEESFRINEVRFNNDVSNIVDYIISKNNVDSAKLNLNQAKYEYVLRVKILDYYRGEMSLN